MAEILVVEDDPVFGEVLSMHLEDRGHRPRLCGDLASARQALADAMPDAILLDQQLPDGHGIELLRELGERGEAPPVIMITGVSDNNLAIEAMRFGAYDYIRKPMDKVELDTTLDNALQRHRLSRQVAVITEAEGLAADITQIVGQSPAILEICKTIGAVAARNAPVLITGESGTGKEVVAKAIHHHSGRPGIFLPVNCSALAEGVLESELFGHEKGSFTGATARKEGRFELASDGTLFLDELGEMPLSLQAKLLRVLQEGTYERVGGTETLRTEARIIAATNRDLKAMIEEGRFREDLYYRLDVVHIHLPPLRERKEDLPLLIEHLLKKINARQHTRIRHLAESTWRKLREYDWPGNIRELENVLTRAAILARGDTIGPELIALPQESAPPGQAAHPEGAQPRLVSLEQIEREHIAAILEHVKWHRGKACEILGISRPALDRKIKKYQLL